jgi:vancomycin resistance protein YoaR
MLWAAIGVSVLMVVGVGVAALAYAAPGNRIVRATHVAGMDVGGLTALEASHKLELAWNDFSAKAFTFTAADRSVTIHVANDTTTDDEFILATAAFDPLAAANEALRFGRRGTWAKQIIERTSGWLNRRHDMAVVHLDEVTLREQLQEKFADLEKPAKNASISVANDGTISILPSTDGTRFDYARIARQAAAQARALTPITIVLTPTIEQPTFHESPELTRVAQAGVQTFLARAPFTLTYTDKSFTLSKETATTLLGFTGTTAHPVVGFDTVGTTAYLATIAKDINVKALNAKFSVVDGRVQEFQASQVGVTLDAPTTITNMQRDIAQGTSTTATIAVVTEQPLTDTVGTNNLGISEIVGTATTNFKGSPTNRRFNLGYGAKLLNGLLIQPGEEFSLVKALGKIDGAHGWKPELVIKGSSITPEFGGGLCQVATTMFRTALNAGLPITERHNHSLRISYYEPPVGLDATIYEPRPDLRFQNDYSHPLLLQTSVEGTLLKFTFYGTKEGRVIDLPEPKVYNKVGIPATKYIEVDDLKPGEQECQKPGHPGADATATYTVTYADGHQNKQVFQSHYRAIGVICRVGKKAASPTPTNTNTSSPPATDTNTAPPADTNTNS